MSDDTRTELEVLRSIDKKTLGDDDLLHVYVTNINMPFGAMVGLVIKFWLATLAAALMLGLILMFISVFLAAFGVYVFRR